jgi:hypothetical protein
LLAVTLSEIDALIAKNAREIEQAEEELAWLKAQGIQLAAMRGEAERRLHSKRGRSNIGSNMQANTSGKSRITRIAAGRATEATAARKAAIEADLTAGKIATICGVGRSTANAWLTGRLAIPSGYADTLAAKGIPRASWKKIN